MRKGYDAKLLFSGKGNLIAISTGSDACAEHECGSKQMMNDLCNQGDEEARVLKEIRPEGFKKQVGQLLGKLGHTPTINYPQLAECKRIVKFPERLQFVLDESGEEPEAYFGYCSQNVTEWKRELDFPSKVFSNNRDLDVAGAWDSRSFAIRVRGKKYVKALQGFYQAVLQGKVLFAGTFLKSRPGVHLSGVILANSQFISDEDKQNIKAVQAEFESKLRLKAFDDADELYREMVKAAAGKVSPNLHIGFLWAKWKDKEESEVVYGLNPGYGVKADYLGPYSRKQLLDWASSGFSYQLKAVHQ